MELVLIGSKTVSGVRGQETKFYSLTVTIYRDRQKNSERTITATVRKILINGEEVFNADVTEDVIVYMISGNPVDVRVVPYDRVSITVKV